MKILKSSQIREVDSYTIKNEQIKSIDLMERAAASITKWIAERYSIKKAIKIFVGPGNNGGDGLAIARQLSQSKFDVKVFILRITDNLSEDSELNLERLRKISKVSIKEIKFDANFPIINSDDLIIDGLFGSGLNRKLDGLAKQLVIQINNAAAKIISIDIPSGLFGEDNSKNDKSSIIKADFTLSFQMPKLAFMFSENYKSVGEWNVLSIGLNQIFIDSLDSPYYYVNETLIKRFIHKRNKFSHKGTYGHVLMVSGSYGKMGAAILATRACLRTGAGLVTCHIPKVGYSIMQTAIPEAMLSIDWSDIIISEIPDVDKYDSIGIGPGIGTKYNTRGALVKLFDETTKPMVIDADAINIISENKELIKKIPVNSILTPHPKEFERLVGKSSDDFERLEKQISFAVDNQFYVVLKGAHTSIACPDGNVYFNSTGNPGMATAGSGDVLTGVILSLLGQGNKSEEAAIYGVYLHGLAGDIASEKIGEEALMASDITDNIGNAFIETRKL
jgi:NAD(P)H-hydrate epimerase